MCIEKTDRIELLQIRENLKHIATTAITERNIINCLAGICEIDEVLLQSQLSRHQCSQCTCEI